MGIVLLLTAALMVALGVALVREDEPARTPRHRAHDRPDRYAAAVLVGLLAVLLLGVAVALPML